MSRRRRRKAPSVELNLAAMLDMAFQLLTFFILTFRPAPVEGQLGLHLPPPVPLTNMKSEKEPSTGNGGGEVSDLETLDLYITANEHGEVSLIKVGLRPVVKGRLNKTNLAALDQHLKSLFDIRSIPLDRVQLAVDDRLRYEELMKIVDVCTKQKLPNGQPMQRISFIEMKSQAQKP
jgi:biopolymer transport protein ExbD